MAHGALPISAWDYNIFVGKAAGNRILSHDECAAIMELPVTSFAKYGETYGIRDGSFKEKPPHELDKLIAPEEYIQRTITENETAETVCLQNGITTEMVEQMADYTPGALYSGRAASLM